MSVADITIPSMSATDITLGSMIVRWEPGSRSRLQEAALALYGERGFENTTVAEIAERAGVTERTFFRHFTDKREVLFLGASSLQELLVAAVASAPDSAFAPLNAEIPKSANRKLGSICQLWAAAMLSASAIWRRWLSPFIWGGLLNRK